jgi:hypothetical protein
MNPGAVTQETLDILKGISGANAPVQKSWTQATGLVAYDLEPGAKLEYPVLTPLRNMIPRVKSNNGDTATRWKQITAINTSKVKPGVSEGNRGGKIATTVTSSLASYAGLGLEDDVSFEAEYASQGFDDAKARAVQGLLNAVMIEEEKVILDGVATTALPAPAAPVATLTGSGSTLTQQATQVWVVALTGDGYRRSSVSGGLIITIARTNADGTSDTINGGTSIISAASNAVTVTAGTQNISATVTAVKGAMAYAWFWGNAIGTALLGAITTINSILITANATGTQAANAAGLNADHSNDVLVFDGLITQALNGQGYYKALATGVAGTGTALTVNNAGGIQEIEDALRSFWDNFKVWPSVIWVNSQELINITNKVLANGGSSTIRFVVDAGSSLSALTAGAIIGFYINKFAGGGGSLIPIRLHPNLTPGTIFFHADKLPYPANGISNLAQIKARQEYYQIEWPLTTRKWPYGVYVDEVLQVYATFPFGVIQNIANG